MVLPFQIDGATVIIPGVYDTLRVQSSLPSPVPAGRSILILGESDEGIPAVPIPWRSSVSIWGVYLNFQTLHSIYRLRKQCI